MDEVKQKFNLIELKINGFKRDDNNYEYLDEFNKAINTILNNN